VRWSASYLLVAAFCYQTLQTLLTNRANEFGSAVSSSGE
jgi:hypothetical protein